MFHSVESLGAVTLDIQGDRLDATFLDENGATLDWFTIEHTAWTDLGQGLAGAGGVPVMCDTRTAAASPPNGRRPHTISYRMQPRAYRSVR